jgi:hypothetical protein
MTALRIYVYRDRVSNRAGEPDDGPTAWAAHRERRRVLADALQDGAFRVLKNDDADDERRTHELSETIVDIVSQPTSVVILSATALYCGKVVAKLIDETVGRGVAYLFQKLTSALKKRKIESFQVVLPDNSRIDVGSDSYIQVLLKEGKVRRFHCDAPPADDEVMI